MNFIQKKRRVEVEDMAKGGPYSLAIIHGNLIFVSGQGAFKESSKNLPDDIESQTTQTLSNIEKILLNAGSSISNILKTTVFLKNITDFPKMNEAYENFFKDRGLHGDFPARTTVSVILPLESMLIEIEVISAL